MRMFALVLMIILGACINSPTPKLIPVFTQEPDSMGWIEATRRISEADGFIIGKITKLEEDWTYDDPCGLIMILRHGCDGTVTYKLHIENDLRDKWLWTFSPAYGTFGLFVGERAVFVWRKTLAYRYQQCRESQGVTSAYCSYDFLDALTSDLDVLPVADSSRVVGIFNDSR